MQKSFLNVADLDGQLGLDLGVFGAPKTYVIDKQGMIGYRHVGVMNEDSWGGETRPLVEL
ncbi:MAG: hypothetical protein V7699_00540 [Porticoccus sp.]